MKVEVKNIFVEGHFIWHAFFPDKTLTSAGIGDIVDQVEDAWPPLEPHMEIHWEAKPTKFVVREVEKKTSKISKSNQ